MCHNPKELRYRAEELRTLVDEMKDEECKKQLRKCADEYEAWANKLESLTKR